MKIIYRDRDIIVCIKPPRVLSTDEPGGLPDMLREELGDKNADIRTVHRLDRVVGGLMVLGCNHSAASELSRQIRDGSFKKIYLAAVHGITEDKGQMRDYMYRDKARKMSFVTESQSKDTREAILNFRTLDRKEGMSLVEVELVTGRTHQIRCQFSSHGFPLMGERKYSLLNDGCELALFSSEIGFTHPKTGEYMSFYEKPPKIFPWNLFKIKS